MHNQELIGPWVRRFLLEHLVGERNLSVNTQRSYRDTLAVLLPLIASRIRKPLDKLQVLDMSSDDVRAFLRHIEEKRGASTSTRNQRLAAVHALARFYTSLEHQAISAAWSAGSTSVERIRQRFQQRGPRAKFTTISVPYNYPLYRLKRERKDERELGSSQWSIGAPLFEDKAIDKQLLTKGGRQ